MPHSTASRSATGRWSTTSAATSPNWRPRRSTRTRSTEAVTTEDKERIRALLRSFGALDQDMAYQGSGRAGYSEAPGGGDQTGTRSQPLDLHEILDAGFWQFQTNFGESWDQAATMMQPVGGMGRIGQAFGRALGGAISYGAEVRALRRTGDGARIVWRDARTGRERAIEAPRGGHHHPAAGAARHPGRLRPGDPRRDRGGRLRAGGEDRVPGRAPVLGTGCGDLRRHLVDRRDITQVWYPSAGIHQRKGILVGAYIWSDDLGEKFAAMPPAHASRPRWPTASGCILTIAGI